MGPYSPQKALISLKNSNIQRYIEQQNLIINAMTQTNICTVIRKSLHTRISLYRPVTFIIGGSMIEDGELLPAIKANGDP